MPNKVLMPFIVIGLAVAFVAASALVVLTRRNPGVLSRKLRIGGALVAIVATLGGTSCVPSCITCYAAPYPVKVDGESPYQAKVGPASREVVLAVARNGSERMRYIIKNYPWRAKADDLATGALAKAPGEGPGANGRYLVRVPESIGPGEYKLVIENEVPLVDGKDGNFYYTPVGDIELIVSDK